MKRIVAYISLLKERCDSYYCAMRKLRIRVKDIAKAQGLSMTKLHKRSDVAYSTIQKLFNDPFAEVTTMTLARLAEALGVPTCEILEDVEEPEEKE